MYMALLYVITPTVQDIFLESLLVMTETSQH